MNTQQPYQFDSTSQTDESLSLQDLIADEKANVLSEYLSVSIASAGDENAKISFTTTDTVPVTYSSILHGVPATELLTLLADAHHLNAE